MPDHDHWTARILRAHDRAPSSAHMSAQDARGPMRTARRKRSSVRGAASLEHELFAYELRTRSCPRRPNRTFPRWAMSGILNFSRSGGCDRVAGSAALESRTSSGPKLARMGWPLHQEIRSHRRIAGDRRSNSTIVTTTCRSLRRRARRPERYQRRFRSRRRYMKARYQSHQEWRPYRWPYFSPVCVQVSREQGPPPRR